MPQAVSRAAEGVCATSDDSCAARPSRFQDSDDTRAHRIDPRRPPAILRRRRMGRDHRSVSRRKTNGAV